jgi:class 3 adenylate cyclase
MEGERQMQLERRPVHLRSVRRGPTATGPVHETAAPPLAPSFPSVTRRFLATVLFVDVVDSTAQAVALGDSRWLKIAYAHEALVTEHVRRYRGRVVQRLGDGAVAVFRGPAAGIRCALALVAATRELGLDLRAGLHVGECVGHGRRLDGLVFHVGARVAAAAAPGEVLVSHAARDLVLGAGLDFVERGRWELKGLPGQWALYAAVPS